MNAYRAGAPLAAPLFAKVRHRMLLEHCKWDPQVGDASTLANFALIMPRPTWQTLAAWAEALSAEASCAERELAERPELLEALGLPRRLLGALRGRGAVSAPRAFRYDFHLTRDGWRISECNADVPGGYAEGSELPALMAEHYPGLSRAGDPGGAWVSALARASEELDVALIAAPGFMEDAQVIHYLGNQLRDAGMRPHCLEPRHLRWRDGRAALGSAPLGAIVRFYQAEWLTQLPREAGLPLLCGSQTPVSNPTSCLAIESKRFPLVWDALASTSLPTWRRLLPETVDPRSASWRSDDGWLLKTALCNTGDTVSVRSLLDARKWARVALAARCFPRRWVAQRRFEPLSLDTPLGPVFPCIGVYTIDGRAAGAYVRLSRGPIVDFAAVDVALLIEEESHVAVA